MLLFLHVENAISYSPNTITFSSHRNIFENRKKQQQAFFGARIISHSQVFQEQLYNQGIAEQNAHLKQLCNELLQQQAIQDGVYAIPVVEEISHTNKPVPLNSKANISQSASIYDLEQHAIEQFQEESEHLKDIIEAYEQPNEYLKNMVKYRASRYE